jgi:hypothetical protein
VILYCAADLLWATRIKATADALAIPCRPARNVEMLRARLSDSEVRGVIVDLESGDQGLALILALRGGVAAADQGGLPGVVGEDPALDPRRRIPVLAFGPHVAVEMFERAKAAGADRVLARGTFDRHLPELLRELEDGPNGQAGAGAGGGP